MAGIRYQDPAPAGDGTGFRSFEDLEVYRLARSFRVEMYRVARQLPDIEKFALADQIRRAAVSLTNNIAEGHGRFHYLEQIKFTLYSRGSLEELQDDLNVCEDEQYMPPAELARLREISVSVHRLINGYLRFLRQRKSGQSLTLKEDQTDYDSMGMDFDDDSLAPETRPMNASTSQPAR